VVTTSQAVSGTLLALADQYGGEGRWPGGVPSDAFVEEALRWSSPVTHFMRRARRDVELHGKTIRKGEAVTAWIASANRDEAVFDQPYAFCADRRPNRHVAFGSGPHRCVGAPLARLMLRLIFEELAANIECFELADPPCHLVSNQIAGMNSLPIRVKPRLGTQSHGMSNGRSTC
jgi:cytochrome P450